MSTYATQGSLFPEGTNMETQNNPTPTGNAQVIVTSDGRTFTRREAITDAGLKHFQDAYPNEAITKEDLFYYIYGILHSPDYRERYADNLAKELPRIPRVQHARDFWHFSKAGRELGHLHLNYESVEKYPLTLDTRGSA